MELLICKDLPMRTGTLVGQIRFKFCFALCLVENSWFLCALQLRHL